jgi:nucleotide-binding universal stress UspA family protein
MLFFTLHRRVFSEKKENHNKENGRLNMRILLATDGSEYSRKAIEKCCKFISAGKHTDIKIISAVERVMPMVAEPFAISNDYYVQVEGDLRKNAEETVAEAEKTISKKFADENVFVQTEVISGNVKQIIIDEAKKFEADLIVVGSHGYGFLDRVLIGSVSDFVVHHAPCSVLVVREERYKDDD